jgi:hypothetical protein
MKLYDLFESSYRNRNFDDRGFVQGGGWDEHYAEKDQERREENIIDKHFDTYFDIIERFTEKYPNNKFMSSMSNSANKFGTLTIKQAQATLKILRSYKWPADEIDTFYSNVLIKDGLGAKLYKGFKKPAPTQTSNSTNNET